MKNSDVVIFAVFNCGGTTTKIDIEYIADEAYKIAPQQFCWKKFTERIDIRIVQYSLKDAKSEKPSRLTGSIKTGYQLSKTGIEWIKNQSEQNGAGFTDSQNKDLGNFINVERLKLKKTSAFKKVKNKDCQNINKRDFENFVRVNSYFSEELINTRVQKIINIIQGDKDLESVWEYLKKYWENSNESN